MVYNKDVKDVACRLDLAYRAIICTVELLEG